jgi:hypothetical protein
MQFDEPAAPLGYVEDVSPPPKLGPRSWGLTVGLVIIFVAAGVIAVNIRPTTKSAILVLSQASARTTSSGSVRIHETETLTLDGRTIPFMDAEGARDFAHKAGVLTVKIGRLSEQVRDVAGVGYLSVPIVELPRGAHWVSFTQADLNLSPNAANTVNSDPTSGLQFLSAIAGNPRVVEHGQLDGIAVTHYAFTVDIRSLVDRLRTANKTMNVPGLGASLDKLGSLVNLSKLPGEAWIDGDGRVRRFDIDIAIAAQSQTAKMHLDMRFSDFDQPVAIQAPAASDTVPFRDVPGFFSEIVNAARNAA